MAGKFGGLERYTSNHNSMFGGLKGAGKKGLEISRMSAGVSSGGINTLPLLDPAAQITDLVCRVNDQWNQDQSTDKESFLNAIRTMTVIENDDGIVPKGLKLSHEQRAALIAAVSTVLNIDQRDVPGEFSHEDHLKGIITNRYGSNDDSVQRFQTDLMQEMEKQAQRQ